MTAFYESVWFLPTAFLVIAVVGEQAARWWRRREAREFAAEDVFEPSQADFDDEFASIVARLRADADRRICEAHERNTSELPGLDGGES